MLVLMNKLCIQAEEAGERRLKGEENAVIMDARGNSFRIASPSLHV